MPSPTPSATDLQALELIQNLQAGDVTNTQALLLALAMKVPGSLSNKLAVYEFLMKLPLPNLTPMEVTIVLVVVFYLFLVGVFLLILLIRRMPTTVIPFIFSKLPKQEKKKIILELTFPADTSKSAYATEQIYSLLHTLARQKTFISRIRLDKNEFSLEIVSTKDKGIRYVLVAGEGFAETIKHSLVSYLPGIQIKEIEDYLPTFGDTQGDRFVGLEEFKLSGHFALPLETQKALKEHDPISFLTGNMTKLAKGELVLFQVITTPLLNTTHERYLREMGVLKHKMIKGEPLTPVLQKGLLQKIVSTPGISLVWFFIKVICIVVWALFTFILEMIVSVLNDSSKGLPVLISQPQPKPQQILNPYEQELSTVVKGKIDQKLFETSIRLLVVSSDSEQLTLRLNGLLATFGQLSSSHQSLTTKDGMFAPQIKKQLISLKKRSLSSENIFHRNPILSASELTDLFHFPYTHTTKTEGMAKLHSVELPAPLSVKNNQAFDVVFGKNTFAGTTVDIGLTDDDRSRHMYIIGQTGSGKTTVIFHMAKDDIQKGRGVAVVDPHGDLAEDLLTTVPKKRVKDCIYFNPFDVKYPIGINLLELSSTKDDDELDQEKELVCESVISIFRRVFSKDENTDAHRIEYILRNAIYTAFTVPGCTIFTVYELLNNPKFQKSVTKNLEDENLKNFWKNEFGRAGNYQVVKMVSGVTAKVGRFLFSPTAKRILEQPHSTINFDEILE